MPISAEPINTDGLIPGLRGEQDPAVKDEIDWTQYASVGEVPLRMVPDLVDPNDKKDSAEYVKLMALMEFEASMCRTSMAGLLASIEGWKNAQDSMTTGVPVG